MFVVCGRCTRCCDVTDDVSSDDTVPPVGVSGDVAEGDVGRGLTQAAGGGQPGGHQEAVGRHPVGEAPLSEAEAVTVLVQPPAGEDDESDTNPETESSC